MRACGFTWDDLVAAGLVRQKRFRSTAELLDHEPTEQGKALLRYERTYDILMVKKGKGLALVDAVRAARKVNKGAEAKATQKAMGAQGRKPMKALPYVSAFDLMDERRVLAVIRRAAVRPTLSFIASLHERLAAGRSLRELMPQAWQPGGNLLAGGYGMAAQAMDNGNVMLSFSVGRKGEAHQLTYEVGFGPRGAVRYLNEVGFSMN